VHEMHSTGFIGYVAVLKSVLLFHVEF
jgi:hypothetical protein